jgi:hypothetical protein
MTTYIFHREDDYWYLIELYDDADAKINAEWNPGTVLVTNALTKEVVWELKKAS